MRLTHVQAYTVACIYPMSRRIQGRSGSRLRLGARRIMQGGAMVLTRVLVVSLLALAAAASSGLAQGSDSKSGRYWLRKCTSPEAHGLIECANYVRALVEYDELRASL